MSNNIYYSKGNIEDKDRQNLTGHKNRVFWFFGLSGSGKSAISRAVEETLIDNNVLCYRLDGDNLRSGLNSDLGFSKQDRLENIRRAAETAKLLANAGIVVLATFITPLKENRLVAREIIGTNLNEIFVKCSIETCKARDPKGLYKKAISGEIPNFTGVSAPFEEPDECTYVIDTDNFDEKTCAKKATKYIMDIIK